MGGRMKGEDWHAKKRTVNISFPIISCIFKKLNPRPQSRQDYHTYEGLGSAKLRERLLLHDFFCSSQNIFDIRSVNIGIFPMPSLSQMKLFQTLPLARVHNYSMHPHLPFDSCIGCVFSLHFGSGLYQLLSGVTSACASLAAIFLRRLLPHGLGGQKCMLCHVLVFQYWILIPCLRGFNRIYARFPLLRSKFVGIIIDNMLLLLLLLFL